MPRWRVAADRLMIQKKFFPGLSFAERQDIDRFIELQGGLIFHETEFNRIVSEVFHTRLFYLVAYHSTGGLKAVCPIHTIKNNFLKLSYSNPAIFEVPYGGWVYDSKQVQLQDLIRKIPLSMNETLIYWSNLQVEGDEYRQHFRAGLSVKQTAVVDLTQSQEWIWKSAVHSKRRNMIRKALKSGVEVEISGSKLYPQYRTMMVDLNRKTERESKPAEYYQQVVDLYFRKKQAVILLARLGKEILAGIIVVGNKNFMHYWQGASQKDAPSLGQGELLQWEAIKWARRNGCRYYDLCVVEPDRLPQIARFKLGFSRRLAHFYLMNRKTVAFKIISRFQKLTVGFRKNDHS